MAAFREQDEEYQRLDYQLLRDSPVILYYKNDILQDAIEWFQKHGYSIHSFKCTDWQTEQIAYKDIGHALSFPDYYNGRSLDAFNDLLSDIEISDEGGTLLVFREFDRFAKSYEQSAQQLLDVIAWTSRFFLLFGKRFIALVQSDNPSIGFQPVGCCHALWNPKEWLLKDRDL